MSCLAPIVKALRIIIVESEKARRWSSPAHNRPCQGKEQRARELLEESLVPFPSFTFDVFLSFLLLKDLSGKVNSNARSGRAARSRRLDSLRSIIYLSFTLNNRSQANASFDTSSGSVIHPFKLILKLVWRTA